MNWDDLKVFLAAAEAPSMRVAAKGLNISHSTVSRRLETLETDMGVSLFDRLSDGYRLTEAGQELLPLALQIEDSLHAYSRRVAGRDNELKGQVCVTMPHVLATGLFMPIIIDFMQAYPEIEVKVIDSFEVFDLSKREADIAIRVTSEPPEHLIGRKLGDIHQAAYATRTYLAQHDLAAVDSSARWVAWGEPEGNPCWANVKNPFPHLGVLGQFSNIELQVAAVKAHMGIGYFPCALVRHDPALVRVSEPQAMREVWLLSHRDLRAAARMRAFRQFITDRIPAIQAALKGEGQISA